MKNARDSLIVTNNPLLAQCMEDCCEIRLFPECSYREILVKVRDLVYAGHTLYTHPLSGSVKPNETPYKSVVVSKVPHAFSAEQAGIISECIQALQTQEYNCAMITFRSAHHVTVYADPEMPWTLDGEREEGHAQVDVDNQHLAIRLVKRV